MNNDNKEVVELPKSCYTCAWFAPHPYNEDEGYCFHDEALICNLSTCDKVECEYHKYFYYEKEVCNV